MAWKASTATIPLTVTAMLAAPSRARRGRRATSRSPSSSGTGSRAESAISPARRRGGAGRVGQRADRAGARGADRGHERGGERHRRAPRPTTSATVGSVSDGAPGATEQAGAGTGEQRGGQPSGQPARPPPRAAPGRRYSASSTAATRPGVPPTALSSPTRRVCSAIRPPTSTATLGDRQQAEQPAADQQDLAARSGTSSAVPAAMLLPRVEDRTAPCRRLALSCASANAGAAAGSASFRFRT